MLNKLVRVVKEISPRDYTREGHEQRVKHVGKCGLVIKESNGHGLCYGVQFLFDSTIAYYDPDELELIAG